MSTVDPEVAERLATELLAAITTTDVEALRRIYAPDVVIWHNFDQREQSVEENLQTLGWMCQRLFDRAYEVVRRERLEDGFLQQHVLRGITRSGAPFAMPACMVVRCEAGRIAAVSTSKGEFSADEYVLATGSWARWAARSRCRRARG